jgi:ADP-heptose:LPS heptosyltransferase
MQVVNLQVGPDRIPPVPYSRFFVSELPATMDFAATARFIADLELVITVDTAMAHLVGALGRSDWVLLPFTADPRWHRHVTHTPWYPNLRLFRQPAPGDWISVIRKVLAAIEGHSRAWCQVP